MRTGHVTLDEQGMIAYASPGAAALLGVSRIALVKQPIRSFILAEDRDIYDRHCREPDRAQPFELRMQKNDGTPLRVRMAAGAAQDENGVPALRIVLTDIGAGTRAGKTPQRAMPQRKSELTTASVIDNRRRSAGNDLQESLGQRLAGISFLAKTLEQQLTGVDSKAALLATSIARQAQDAVVECKNLARDLALAAPDSGELTAALRALAARTEALFGVACRFECEQGLSVFDVVQSLNLYRIAEEACSNAVHRGRARQVTISLSRAGGRLRLSVSDDGSGFAAAAPGARESPGLGIEIMRYRASLMRAQLQLLTSAQGGVEVRVDTGPDAWPASTIDRENIAVAASGRRRK